MSDEHLPLFTEFVKAEKAVGGPDAQLELLCELGRMNNCDIVESVWLAGCYGAVHCIPSAYLTWQNFRPQDIIDKPQALFDWLMINWDYLPVRPEMRSARMVEKRHECLVDF